MSEERSVRESVVVETTPELAFEALTRASELREWFCDQAWTQVRPGGRYTARWNQGYQVEGLFGRVEAPRLATSTWRGSGEPGETTVTYTVEPLAEGVRVTVEHGGFGPGAEWDAAVAEGQKGWALSLENLKSILESGIDLRQARQPFLGINFDLLTPERAAAQGIAAERGICITGVGPGSAAEAAGLGNGDVLVALGGVPTPGIEELGAALRSHQAGDTVDLVLVRGQERTTVPATLGTRPQPELPADLEALADLVAGQYREANAGLEEALQGVSEEEAGQAPGPREWSVKQVLAHLSDGERALHMMLPTWAVVGWLDAEPFWPDQVPGRLAAVLAVAPTLPELLARFITDGAETVALLRGLPPQATSHKARYRRIARFVLFGPDHTREHTAQIRQVLAVVRGQG